MMSEEIRKKETTRVVSPEDPEGKVILPECSRLILSSSPHVHAGPHTRGIMLRVILCLLPAVAASLLFFGLQALRVLVICMAASAAFEYLWCRICRKTNTVGDLSALLTGLIIALNVSPLTPAWVCIAGSFVAIIIAKQVYGGLGQNPFNPAAVARIAMLVGAAGPMTRWMDPVCHIIPETAAMATATPHAAEAAARGVDAIASATPLSAAAHCASAGTGLSYFNSWDFLSKAFIGQIGGSLGETSALALLIGGIALIAMKLIRWQIPASILGTVFLFVSLVNFFAPGTTPGPLFHLCTGGLMIGAFFMATDMVTSPVTVKGGVVFGIGIGIIVCVIRIYGSYPEGMSFAIVMMNALVPLIDKFCYVRPFGCQNIKANRMEPRRGEIR